VMNYDKTIEPMAAAIYEADPYHGIEDWSALCGTAGHEGYALHKLASEEKIACIEKAKAALSALQGTMPAVSEYEEPIDIKSDLWDELKNLGK